jgi:hypothetical protein
MPNGLTLSKVRDDRVLGLERRLLRMHAHVQPRPRVGLHGGHGLVDRGHVDPGHRDGGAGPDALAEGAGAQVGHAGQHLGEPAELLVGVGGTGPRRAHEAGHGDVAVLVVQRGERVDERQQRVGGRAPELTAVLVGPESSDLDVDRGVAAQTRPRGSARPVGRCRRRR